MPTLNYTITFTPPAGGFGTLIEYKAVGDTTWIVPNSAPNPTTLDSYTLLLQIGVNYVVRLSTEGACTRKYVYLAIPVGSCCPAGYTLSDDGTYCYVQSSTTPTSPSAPETLVAVSDVHFSMCGTKIMDEGFALNGNGTYTAIPTSVPFWINNGGVCVPGDTSAGPMNRNAVWSSTTTDGQTIGFSVCIDVPETKTYYIGVAFDNYGQISIDGNVILQTDDFTSVNPLENWTIFPVRLTQGSHVLGLVGINGTAPPPNPGAIAAEIYDNTRAQILASTGYGDLTVLFKTADYVGQDVQIGSDGIGYTCPDGYVLRLCDGPPVCIKITTTPPIAC